MSMITLFSAFMGLYVIVRLILPSGMNWSLKLILSLFAFACAEKLLLTKLVYGTMGAFMPEPVQLASGYLHSAVTILFLLLVVRDALLLLTWPFRRSTRRQRKIFYGHKEKKPASGFWAFTLVLLALGLSVYGMREALRVPPVREVRMQVPGLPDALNGFRIAQLFRSAHRPHVRQGMADGRGGPHGFAQPRSHRHHRRRSGRLPVTP